ncbi:hypothetical protein ACFSJ3_11160 [Corallincola platygyrae]|uniref:Uncharacterized protein n=1 Tax=Corallincola platygyrae TaxID=1193278 RepID=A0ABW4XLU9_9GAMM
MRFKQARELLLFVADARLALSKLYQSWVNRLENPRSRLLLEFLVTREQEQRRALKEYIELATPAALDTWFDNTSESDLMERIDGWTFAPDIDEHDLLGEALKLDNELMGLLSQQVPNAASVETQELLINLLAHEQERQRRMIHGVARMDDI